MSVRIAVVQANFIVGDIVHNTQLVSQFAAQAKGQGAQILLCPELCLTGYPPEDLLLRPSLAVRIAQALAQLATIRDILLVVGYPKAIDGVLYNMAGAWFNGQCLAEYAKQKLPNYQVFDEKRYFSAGHQSGVFSFAGVQIGLSVCEDIWHPEPLAQAKQEGAQLILNLNASPFHLNKQAERIAVVKQRALETQLPIVYANLLGGQDELVFDGGSFAVNANGEVAYEAALFEESLMYLDYDHGFSVQPRAPVLTEEAAAYQALVLGVRDYVNKCGFKGVILGLSGGIDSALVLAIAVDALGAERVNAVMMPYHYTSQMSLEDAAAEANTLGVNYSVIEIAPAVHSFSQLLAPHFAGLAKDKTEENLQARSRGVLLMAISNKKGWLVLTTGNKSEMAVGYATLYGDMAGGFDVLKDVPKTLVFRLAAYRNQVAGMAVIPQRVIDRPPSAELAPDQKDEDSLPPYAILDAILALYIEHDYSAEAIIGEGFDRETVYKVLKMVDFNEYKRRQAAIGPRITQRGFGRDRRYPLVNGWKVGI
ncbi:NAD+ synthase [Agitococcus lubricus]|uniref:Glutamine-dependent NAD(+) synthetase n=1 Tax=Agitococcus lubricus TaxID=1077255 RepID=A0A2T5J2C7_9GAMM|nr:NAD+ synthase [Agitococcus lubricus]PTQ90670.1 NAD+ synthase (glutamine-hydrolysing) [Agitococcus lubricus]